MDWVREVGAGTTNGKAWFILEQRQGLPQSMMHGAGGRRGLKVTTRSRRSRSVCTYGNSDGVIILVTGGCLKPGLFSGFGSSVILNGGGDKLLVRSMAREDGRFEPVSRIFQTSMAVVMTVRRLSLALSPKSKATYEEEFSRLSSVVSLCSFRSLRQLLRKQL